MSSSPSQRHLILLRHAQAEQSATTDYDRVLTVTGRAQATVVGQRILERDVVPDLVLCSAAVRAKQTWQLAATALGDAADAVTVTYSEDLYSADVDEVLDLLRAVSPEVGRVLVVGHEPVLSGTAHRLAGPKSQESAALRVRTGISTATAAFLEFRAPWSTLTDRAAVLTGLSTAPTGE
ncbi:histidine phosphatase family protein [Occultella glacieicola]|uniref:Histidine phosphatase family protein n=1 Tax=Occultella glacieicola TaxID=2518684 RepID=A0ABY2E0R3_9MICO|nr:histidine phosphatase family protein [Occultella glacieicola]TDE90310.1 histidine phosphatase family protein [Occultella glacieicola]